MCAQIGFVSLDYNCIVLQCHDKRSVFFFSFKGKIYSEENIQKGTMEEVQLIYSLIGLLSKNNISIGHIVVLCVHSISI